MKKFAFYLENGESVSVGDKLHMKQFAHTANTLSYGIQDANNEDEGFTLCSNDYNDQNYLSHEVMDTLPENITITICEVNPSFGLQELIFSIDELENT